MAERPGRFTGKQITTMVVALCVAVVAFPVGVYAATSAVTIADATSGTTAKVNTQGRLLVAPPNTVQSAASGAVTTNATTVLTTAGFSTARLDLWNRNLDPSGVTVTAIVTDSHGLIFKRFNLTQNEGTSVLVQVPGPSISITTISTSWTHQELRYALYGLA
jgi:hypothetical protein